MLYALDITEMNKMKTLSKWFIAGLTAAFLSTPAMAQDSQWDKVKSSAKVLSEDVASAAKGTYESSSEWAGEKAEQSQEWMEEKARLPETGLKTNPEKPQTGLKIKALSLANGSMKLPISSQQLNQFARKGIIRCPFLLRNITKRVQCLGLIAIPMCKLIDSLPSPLIKKR